MQDHESQPNRSTPALSHLTDALKAAFDEALRAAEREAVERWQSPDDQIRFLWQVGEQVKAGGGDVTQSDALHALLNAIRDSGLTFYNCRTAEGVYQLVNRTLADGYMSNTIRKTAPVDHARYMEKQAERMRECGAVVSVADILLAMVEAMFDCGLDLSGCGTRDDIRARLSAYLLEGRIQFELMGEKSNSVENCEGVKGE